MVIYNAFGYVLTLAFETFTVAVTYSRCILIHFCIPVKSNCFLFEFPKKTSFQGHPLLCVKQKFLNFDCFLKLLLLYSGMTVSEKYPISFYIITFYFGTYLFHQHTVFAAGIIL